MKSHTDIPAIWKLLASIPHKHPATPFFSVSGTTFGICGGTAYYFVFFQIPVSTLTS